jgi:hypothetical protein
MQIIKPCNAAACKVDVDEGVAQTQMGHSLNTCDGAIAHGD